jgi:hypothetical protein
MGNVKSTHSHTMHILHRLYNGEQLTSLDLGNLMSNPNQYFCKLKDMRLIGERIITHNVKVHFLPPKARKRAKALLDTYDKEQINLFTISGQNATPTTKRLH